MCIPLMFDLDFPHFGLPSVDSRDLFTALTKQCIKEHGATVG